MSNEPVNIEPLNISGVDVHTPITPDKTIKLKAGDVVFLSGTLIQGMENVVRRAAKEDVPVHADDTTVLSIGFARYQVDEGTAGRKKRPGEIVPPFNTTGIRSIPWLPDVIEKRGVRMILAKDGLGDDQRIREVCEEYDCVVLRPYTFPPQISITGSLRGVKEHFWQDLPERGYILDVERLGPYIVNIDTHGGCMAADRDASAKAKLPEIYEKLGIRPGFEPQSLEYQ